MTLAPPSPRSPSPTTAVVGDGTTLRTRTRSRWQRVRWPIAVVVTFLVLVGLSSLLQARTSTVPFAPDNPNPSGARALAQILEDQGVHIEYTRSPAHAVALAEAGTTLLVTPTTWGLSTDQIADLTRVDADLVLVGVDGYSMQQFTGWAIDVTGPPSGRIEPNCDDPDGLAAERISRGMSGVTSTDADVDVCFTDGSGTGGYAVLDADRRVAVIADAGLMTNDALDEEGNAALLLRNLGKHETLVWLVPDPYAMDGGAASGGLEVLPRWAVLLGLQGAVVILALALWRGRRLGRIVSEPLPVTVRAAEATVGRGRLYRRSQSWGHAAAALRAGTANRVAGRLGIPRTAAATDVIDAVARATGRPIEQVADLLYGPPPTDDTGLVQLAHRLDELESEVHRT